MKFLVTAAAGVGATVETLSTEDVSALELLWFEQRVRRLRARVRAGDHVNKLLLLRDRVVVGHPGMVVAYDVSLMERVLSVHR